MRQMERSIPPAGSIRLTDPELHRQVCQNYLPRRILRRKKRGFAVNVVDEWFRSSMEGEIPTMLLNEKALLFDLLKPEQVRQLLNSHKSGQQDNHKLLFSLVMLEQWLRGDRSARKPEYGTLSH